MKEKLLYIIMCVAAVSATLPGNAIDRKSLVSYANELKGLKKAELKTAIFNSCQPVLVLNYGSGEGGTWSGFLKTDRIGNTLECRNRYSTERFYFASETVTNCITGMNIEHSFPKSWWGKAENNAYKDLFNLYPSSLSENNAKSNYPMGKVTNPTLLDSYERVGKGSAGALGSIMLCEPNDMWKGDFCRSYFYMATIYQNLTWQGTQGLQELENDTWPTLQEWAYTLYLEWAHNDTVSSIEVDRNNAIYDIQGNRNLFIDFPYLAEYVWGDSVNVAFDPATSITTASDDDRYKAATQVAPDGPDDPVKPGNPGEKYDDAPATISDGDYYFAETFDGCDSNGGADGLWSGTIGSGNIDSLSTSNADWTFVKGFEGNQCVKLGSSSALGSATTPEIKGLKGTSFILYFDAGGWNTSSESNTITVSAENCELSDSVFTLTKGAFNTYSIRITNVTGNVKFTFSGSGSKNRFFLDNVFIPKESIIDPSQDYIAYFIYSITSLF